MEKLPQNLFPETNKERNVTDIAERKRRKETIITVAKLALFGSTLVLPEVFGYTHTYRDAAGGRHVGVTDKGNAAIESMTDRGDRAIGRVVGEVDSAIDSVAGVFHTGPDKDGNTIDYVIEDNLNKINEITDTLSSYGSIDQNGTNNYVVNGDMEYPHSDATPVSTPDSTQDK